MILKNIDNPFIYDMKNICTVFFPNEKIVDSGYDDIEVITKADGLLLSVFARIGDKSEYKQHTIENKDDMQCELSVLLYKTLSALTSLEFPWGILFGVRPAKLMHRLVEKMGEENAREYFINNFLVSDKKTDLTIDVMHRENKIIDLSKKNSFSLYVSIPFCPTRCSYCSFVSHSIERTAKLLEPYVTLLCREIEETAAVANKLNLRLETIYFGGGTPTTLSAEHLNSIFSAVSSNFDLSHLREYTVEAGRPDTINEQKLMAIKNAGVKRISINPQTFNDEVLTAIGRKHTARQTIEAFEFAKSCGFEDINMDLIAGLPKDDLHSFKNSIDTAISLNPSNITIHTLALKSASYLVTKDNANTKRASLITSDMVDYSNSALKSNGYFPYYMYRQSKSAGNLENVGWCRENKECLYNIYMMDETHSVLAVGAGAVTRLKNCDSGKIERIYNFKYPYEYIDRFDEMLSRKAIIEEFYGI